MKLRINSWRTTLKIECANWPEKFPYKPEVKVDVAHDADSLFLEFEVREEWSCALADEMGSVWEDSCVEFFFDPDGKGEYYNLECSCTGWIYLCKGTGRCGRIPLDDTALKSIKRRCTLPQEAFGLLGERTQWELWLDVPASVFGLESFEGLRARGNFYKCADASPFRHYLSYAPIATPKPDFHRPEFFETILFD